MTIVLDETRQTALDQAQEDFRVCKDLVVKQGKVYFGKTFSLPLAAQIDDGSVMAEINKTDFKGVLLKLTHPRFGLGWTNEEAQDAMEWYKKYLFLVAKYPTVKVVPNREIDEFWHQHLLDTRAYMKDCQRIFGKFHHHWPYAGMLGDDNYHEWIFNTVVTEQLFLTEFGIDYGDIGQKCTCFGGKCS